jgi:hypothetical protein
MADTTLYFPSDRLYLTRWQAWLAIIKLVYRYRGPEGINKSHFVGAVYGMERMMGKADTPVRKLLNYASEHFIPHLPVVYVQTVIGRDESGKLVIRGLFIGDDEEVFRLASELSLKVNFTVLDEPLKKVVVYLDPVEFKSTWLGNKSIYRTRMAMADEGS